MYVCNGNGMGDTKGVLDGLYSQYRLIELYCSAQTYEYWLSHGCVLGSVLPME